MRLYTDASVHKRKDCEKRVYKLRHTTAPLSRSGTEQFSVLGTEATGKMSTFDATYAAVVCCALKRTFLNVRSRFLIWIRLQYCGCEYPPVLNPVCTRVKSFFNFCCHIML